MAEGDIISADNLAATLTTDNGIPANLASSIASEVNNNTPDGARPVPPGRQAQVIVQPDNTDPNRLSIIEGYTDDSGNFVPTNVNVIVTDAANNSFSISERPGQLPPTIEVRDGVAATADINATVQSASMSPDAPEPVVPPVAPPVAPPAPTELGTQLAGAGVSAGSAENVAGWIRERDREDSPEVVAARGDSETLRIVQRGEGNTVNIVSGYMNGDTFVPTSVLTVDSANNGPSMGRARPGNLPESIPATLDESGHPVVDPAHINQVVRQASIDGPSAPAIVAEPAVVTPPSGHDHPVGAPSPMGNHRTIGDAVGASGGEIFVVRTGNFGPDSNIEIISAALEARNAGRDGQASSYYAVVEENGHKVVLAGKRENGNFVVDQAFVVGADGTSLAPAEGTRFTPGTNVATAGNGINVDGVPRPPRTPIAAAPPAVPPTTTPPVPTPPTPVAGVPPLAAAVQTLSTAGASVNPVNTTPAPGAAGAGPAAISAAVTAADPRATSFVVARQNGRNVVITGHTEGTGNNQQFVAHQALNVSANGNSLLPAPHSQGVANMRYPITNDAAHTVDIAHPIPQVAIQTPGGYNMGGNPPPQPQQPGFRPPGGNNNPPGGNHNAQPRPHLGGNHGSFAEHRAARDAAIANSHHNTARRGGHHLGLPGGGNNHAPMGQNGVTHGNGNVVDPQLNANAQAAAGDITNALASGNQAEAANALRDFTRANRLSARTTNLNISGANAIQNLPPEQLTILMDRQMPGGNGMTVGQAMQNPDMQVAAVTTLVSSASAANSRLMANARATPNGAARAGTLVGMGTTPEGQTVAVTRTQNGGYQANTANGRPLAEGTVVTVASTVDTGAGARQPQRFEVGNNNALALQGAPTQTPTGLAGGNAQPGGRA